VNLKKLLSGKSLVITRSSEQSEPLFSDLTNLGAHVISLPLITIADPIDGGKEFLEKVKNLSAYNWVVVTSPNGANRLIENVDELENFQKLKIGVIGKSTAEVFEKFGITVDLIPERTFSEGFVEIFPTPLDEENRILLVQAEKARTIIYEGLRNLGWQIDKVVAYRNIDAEIEKESLLEAKSADAIVFTASSAVNRYHEISGVPEPLDAICIGPITGETAQNLGWKVFEAREQSAKDLVEAVKQWAAS
jgi:uroporphyrinogen-III synthase|tara:strand:- start:39 stop:785 length:747 start_codon:yes stop_codon:yes gene_type:complete